MVFQYGINDFCYRQLAAQTETFPDDAVSPGNNFLPQYQSLYAQNSDLVGWIQIDGTGINYPVMQSKFDASYRKLTDITTFPQTELLIEVV